MDRMTMRATIQELRAMADRLEQELDAEERSYSPDQLRMQAMASAATFGGNMARSEDYATPDLEAELWAMLRARYPKDRQLAEAARDGARAEWSSRISHN